MSTCDTWLPRIALAAALVLIGACDDGLLLVTAREVPLEAPTLRAELRAAPAGAPGVGALDAGGAAAHAVTLDRTQDAAAFNGTTAWFGLRRGAGLDGDVTLELAALDAAGCALALGEQTRAVGPGQRVVYDITLRRSMTLQVRVAGARAGGGGGAVVTSQPTRCQGADPAGFRCRGACAGVFAAGQTLELTAQPEDGSYFAGWGGDCQGLGACTVRLDAPRLVEAYFAPRVCSAGRFCWYSPLPQGNQLNRVWAARADDVWAVGKAGTILRWDGHVWAAVAGGADVNLLGVWGRPSGDVWAVGDPIGASTAGAILRWNGSSWSQQTNVYPGSLTSVYAGPADPVWAVNADGVLAGVGDRWLQELAVKGLVALGGDGQDVWAVGAAIKGGRIWHRAGGAWQQELTGLDFAADLSAVSVAAGEVWIAGAQGTLLHRDPAGAWTKVDLGLGASAPNLTGVWSSGRGDVWVVGAGGALLHREGGRFVPRRDLGTDAAVDLAAVHGVDDLWVVGGGGAMIHVASGGASASGLSRAARVRLWDVGGGADDVWAVATDGTALRSRLGWRFQPVLAGRALSAVWGAATGARWIVGDGGLLLDGASGASGSNLTTAALRAVSGSPAGDVWAAGDSGVVLRNAGEGWTSLPVQADIKVSLSGLWARDPAYAVVVGQGGAIFTIDGASARRQPNADARSLTRVAGSGDKDLWAVGDQGVVLHNGGAGWTVTDAQVGAIDLAALWVPGPGEVWAGGSFGTLRHLKDGVWKVVPSGTTNVILGLWGQGADVWAVGSNDMVLRYRPAN